MPGIINIELLGADEMERVLTELGSVATRIGDNAVRAGMKVIATEAKRLVPRDTGALGDSITVVIDRGSEDGERVALLGFERPHSARAHLTEYGTSRSRAQPFVRPALDSKANEALEKMGASLARGINREAKKLAKA